MMINQSKNKMNGPRVFFESIKQIGFAAVLCGLVFLLQGQVKPGQVQNKPSAAAVKSQPKTSVKTASSKPGKYEPKVLYRFSEHLADAQTEIYIPAKEERRPGKWDGKQLVIENLSASFSIQKTVQNFNKQLKQGIHFKAVPEAVRILCFHDVPPGAALVIYSGIPDTLASPESTPATVYLTVWAGIHRLARLSVPTVPGWNSVQLDLGVVSLLMKPIIVTFEITVDDKSNRSFAFDAEILD